MEKQKKLNYKRFINSSTFFCLRFNLLRIESVSVYEILGSRVKASHVNFPDVLPLKVNLINHLHRRTYTKETWLVEASDFVHRNSRFFTWCDHVRNKRFHILLSCVDVVHVPRLDARRSSRERRGGGRKKEREKKIRGIISSPSSTGRKIPWVMSL